MDVALCRAGLAISISAYGHVYRSSVLDYYTLIAVHVQVSAVR
jgi:hypothetical protein